MKLRNTSVLAYIKRSFFFVLAVCFLLGCSLGKSTTPFPSASHPNIEGWPEELDGYFLSINLEMLDMVGAFAAISDESIDRAYLIGENRKKTVKELIHVERLDNQLLSISEVKALHASKVPFDDEENGKRYDFFTNKHIIISDHYGGGEIYPFQKRDDYYIFDESHIMMLDQKQAVAYGVDLDFMSMTGKNYISADETPFQLKEKDGTYFLNFVEDDTTFVPIFIEPSEEGYLLSILDEDAIGEANAPLEEEIIEDVEEVEDAYDENDPFGLDNYEYVEPDKKFRPKGKADIQAVIKEKQFRKEVLLLEPFEF